MALESTLRGLAREGKRKRLWARSLAGLVCGVCVAWLAMGVVAPVWAQDTRGAVEDYQDLWKRGEYRQALEQIQELVKASDNYVSVRLRRDLAELLFLTGHVDAAIKQMERITDQYPEPAHTLDLALMYKYRGSMAIYEKTLRRAAMQTRDGRWRYSRRNENIVAVARIAELLGENPKTVLNTHYNIVIESNPRMAIAHVGAGELAYRHSGYDIAAKHYQNALDIDPNHQEALAGLIECYWKSNDGRAEEAIQRLLNLNPNHPRARAVQVEQLLDLRKTSEALNIIEEQLEINPINLRFLGLKSAAHYLDNDLEAMSAAQQKALEFNSHYSGVYRITGRLASRHYHFKEGAEFQEKALEVDPEDYESRALYTQDLLRLGREEVGRAELEKAFDADPYNVQLYNQLQLMDTLEDFSTIGRSGFELKLPQNEAPVIGDDALDLLENAIVELEAKYDVNLERPIKVQMFDDHDDFMVRSVGLPGNVGHLGICFGSLVTMDSPLARPRGSWNWRSVLWHEFVHVVTLQKTKNRMPRWLSEGISVYEEGQFSPAWSNQLDPNYRKVLVEQDLPSVRDIPKFFIQPESSLHLMFGYFSAGEFVQFYVDEYGMDALNEALDAIGTDKDTFEALSDAAGDSIRRMDGAFHAYLEERLKPLENVSDEKQAAVMGYLEKLFGGGDDKADDSDERLVRNDGAAETEFGKLLAKADAAREAGDYDKLERFLWEAHEMFPDYRGPDAPIRQLVQFYEARNERENLKRALRTQVLWAPAELDAATKLANMYAEEGNWRDVTRWADWALGIDPYDVKIQELYLRGLMNTDQEESALDTLAVLAHLDDAHGAEYRLQRAELLANRGDYGDAKTEVVRVLEEIPHFWNAQRLLLDIVESKEEPASGVTF